MSRRQPLPARPTRCPALPRRQRGVAIVTALLVVVLSAVLVSGVVWRVYKNGRSVMHESSRIQARQVMRSAIEWASVILREDARVSATDTLAEPWAVPLADTRLDESLRPQVTGADRSTSARLSGQIEDAQSRFNLYNLGMDNAVAPREIRAFRRLCNATGLDAQRCDTVIQTARKRHNAVVRQWTDLRNEGGIDDTAIETLKPYVVWLPTLTRVNANTAPAEVLYAVLQGIDFSGAQQLVITRDRAAFKDEADVRSRMASSSPGGADMSQIDVKSQYFLVKGSVQVQESRLRAEALIQRQDNRVYTVWRID